MKRFATVRGADNEKHLDAYIDGTDYEIIGRMDDVFIIAGEDVAGWTLDDYVIPRLASGLIFADEIELDRLKIKVAAAESQIRQLQIQLEVSMAK